MSGMHPSEETLQLYVLDREACRPEEIAHIGSCPDCRAAVAAYELLTDGLAAQPAPTFSFDLTAAVLERVQTAKTKERPQAPVREWTDTPARDRKSGMAVIAAMIALVIGVAAWLFWKSAYFVFTDMSATFYWVLLAAAAISVGLFILRLYKKYQDVINLINK